MDHVWNRLEKRKNEIRSLHVSLLLVKILGSHVRRGVLERENVPEGIEYIKEMYDAEVFLCQGIVEDSSEDEEEEEEEEGEVAVLPVYRVSVGEDSTTTSTTGVEEDELELVDVSEESVVVVTTQEEVSISKPRQSEGDLGSQRIGQESEDLPMVFDQAQTTLSRILKKIESPQSFDRILAHWENQILHRLGNLTNGTELELSLFVIQALLYLCYQTRLAIPSLGQLFEKELWKVLCSEVEKALRLISQRNINLRDDFSQFGFEGKVDWENCHLSDEDSDLETKLAWKRLWTSRLQQHDLLRRLSVEETHLKDIDVALRNLLQYIEGKIYLVGSSVGGPKAFVSLSIPGNGQYNVGDADDGVLTELWTRMTQIKEEYLPHFRIDAERAFETLRREVCDEMQKRCRDLVSRIQDFIQEGNTADCRYHCRLLLQELESDDFFEIPAPMTLLLALGDVFESVLELDERSVSVLLGLVDCVHAVCRSVWSSQKRSGLTINCEKKNRLLELTQALLDRFGDAEDSYGFLLEYRLVCISQCLKMIGDDYDFKAAVYEALDWTAPGNMLALLQSRWESFPTKRGILNPVPFYRRVLEIDFRVHLFESVRQMLPHCPRRACVCLVSWMTVIEECLPDTYISYAFSEAWLKYFVDIAYCEGIERSCRKLAPLCGISFVVPDPLSIGIPIAGIDVRKGSAVSVAEKQETFAAAGLGMFEVCQFMKTWNRLVLCVRSPLEILSQSGLLSSRDVSRLCCRRPDFHDLLASDPENEFIQRLRLEEASFTLYDDYCCKVIAQGMFLGLKLPFCRHLSAVLKKDGTEGELSLEAFFRSLISGARNISTKSGLLFLLGEGGSGKSAILRHLAYRAYVESLTDKDMSSLNSFYFYAGLCSGMAEWGDLSVSKRIDLLCDWSLSPFEDQLKQHFSYFQLAEFRVQFRNIFATQRVALFFDAANEVPLDDRPAFCAFLKGLLEEDTVSIVSVVVSSRTQDYDDFAEFFEDSDVALEKWCIVPTVSVSREIVRNVLLSTQDSAELRDKVMERFDDVSSCYGADRDYEDERTSHDSILASPLIAILLLLRLLSTDVPMDNELKSNKFRFYDLLLLGMIRGDKEGMTVSTEDNVVLSCSDEWIQRCLAVIGYLTLALGGPTKLHLKNVMSNHFTHIVGKEVHLETQSSPVARILDSLIVSLSCLTKTDDRLVFVHEDVKGFYCARFVLNVDDDASTAALIKCLCEKYPYGCHQEVIYFGGVDDDFVMNYFKDRKLLCRNRFSSKVFNAVRAFFLLCPRVATVGTPLTNALVDRFLWSSDLNHYDFLDAARKAKFACADWGAQFGVLCSFPNGLLVGFTPRGALFRDAGDLKLVGYDGMVLRRVALERKGCSRTVLSDGYLLLSSDVAEKESLLWELTSDGLIPISFGETVKSSWTLCHASKNLCFTIPVSKGNARSWLKVYERMGPGEFRRRDQFPLHRKGGAMIEIAVPSDNLVVLHSSSSELLTGAVPSRGYYREAQSFLYFVSLDRLKSIAVRPLPASFLLSQHFDGSGFVGGISSSLESREWRIDLWQDFKWYSDPWESSVRRLRYQYSSFRISLDVGIPSLLPCPQSLRPSGVISDLVLLVLDSKSKDPARLLVVDPSTSNLDLVETHEVVRVIECPWRFADFRKCHYSRHADTVFFVLRSGMPNFALPTGNWRRPHRLGNHVHKFERRLSFVTPDEELESLSLDCLYFNPLFAVPARGDCVFAFERDTWVPSTISVSDFDEIKQREPLEHGPEDEILAITAHRHRLVLAAKSGHRFSLLEVVLPRETSKRTRNPLLLMLKKVFSLDEAVAARWRSLLSGLTAHPVVEHNSTMLHFDSLAHVGKQIPFSLKCKSQSRVLAELGEEGSCGDFVALEKFGNDAIVVVFSRNLFLVRFVHHPATGFDEVRVLDLEFDCWAKDDEERIVGLKGLRMEFERFDYLVEETFVLVQTNTRIRRISLESDLLRLKPRPWNGVFVGLNRIPQELPLPEQGGQLIVYGLDRPPFFRVLFVAASGKVFTLPKFKSHPYHLKGPVLVVPSTRFAIIQWHTRDGCDFPAFIDLERLFFGSNLADFSNSPFPDDHIIRLLPKSECFEELMTASDCFLMPLYPVKEGFVVQTREEAFGVHMQGSFSALTHPLRTHRVPLDLLCRHEEEADRIINYLEGEHDLFSSIETLRVQLGEMLRGLRQDIRCLRLKKEDVVEEVTFPRERETEGEKEEEESSQRIDDAGPAAEDLDVREFEIHHRHVSLRFVTPRHRKAEPSDSLHLGFVLKGDPAIFEFIPSGDGDGDWFTIKMDTPHEAPAEEGSLGVYRLMMFPLKEGSPVWTTAVGCSRLDPDPNPDRFLWRFERVSAGSWCIQSKSSGSWLCRNAKLHLITRRRSLDPTAETENFQFQIVPSLKKKKEIEED